MPLITFRVFEPLTAKWKEALNYNWGSNAVGSDIILLTRCRDTKAFYEVVFHELYEWLTNQNHDDVILEERKYIEKKSDTKLGEQSARANLNNLRTRTDSGHPHFIRNTLNLQSEK